VTATIDDDAIVYPSDLSQDDANELVERLFVQASSGELKYRDLVQPSKDSLIALGEMALPEMLTKLSLRNAPERWTVVDVFRGLGNIATDSLLQYLDSDDRYVLTAVGRCLGEIQDTSSTMSCLPFLGHERYTIRAQFCFTLGKNADTRGVPELIRVLEVDTIAGVRTAASVALGRIADNRAVDALISALDDSYYGVRKTAALALSQFEYPPLNELSSAVESMSVIGKGMVIETLGMIGSKEAISMLKSFLKSPDVLLRGYTIDALASIDSHRASRLLENKNLDNEHDIFVRSRLRAARDRLADGG
jgi:HEAT repeat protein